MKNLQVGVNKYNMKRLVILGAGGYARTICDIATQSAKYREKFDFATARAVARLNVLSEYCLPFVKEKGSFVAMKASVTDEVDEAQGAIRLLGGKLSDIKEFSLPDGSERRLVVIKKISQTPPKYPRASAQIAKKALK